jgi:hypothetical protein
MFPSLTRPFVKTAAEIARARYEAGEALGLMFKAGGDAVKVHALSGELYASGRWILLRVPNALVRGAFDALDEQGAQLPLKDGRLNAHCTVFRPEEVDRIGGVDMIHERGHHFRYTLGPIKEVAPAGWDEMSKVWFIEVSSPELERLRKSYGLSALPNEGQHAFHITIGVRKKHVLNSNQVTKISAAKSVGVVAAVGPQDSGAQQLALDDRAVREPEQPGVPELRRPGYPGRSKVAEQLRRVSGGHGAATAEGDAGEAGHQRPLRTDELRLGNAKAAEPQPEKQSANHGRRSDADAVGVGRGVGRLALDHPQPNQGVGVVGREGGNDAGVVGSRRASDARVSGASSDVDGLVKGTGTVGHDHQTAVASRLVGRGGTFDAVAAGASNLLSVLKTAEERGPEGEYCPHCDARLERDPYSGTCNSCGGVWGEKTAAEKTASLMSGFQVDRPRGSYKQFRDPADPLLKDYPIEGVTYPTDYGFLPGYVAEDDDDLDVFKGSGSTHGFMRVSRPDARGGAETKFMYGLTPEEFAAVTAAFRPVLSGEPETVDEATLVGRLASFKRPQESAVEKLAHLLDNRDLALFAALPAAGGLVNAGVNAAMAEKGKRRAAAMRGLLTGSLGGVAGAGFLTGVRKYVQAPNTDAAILPAVGTAAGAYGLSQLLMRTKDPIADKVLGPAPWRKPRKKGPEAV